MVMVLILLVPLVLGLDECKRVTPPSDIPCRVTTTWEPPNLCSTYQVTIYNSNGTNLSTSSLSTLGSTGFCIFNFTITEPADYPYNITTGDTGNVLVQSEDNMTSLSVTIFIILINIAIFLGPSFIQFSKNPPLNNLMSKMVYILGLTFLTFNTTIIISLAENAGLGISQELFRYQFFFIWGIYFAILFLFFYMIVTTMKMWRVQKTKKRMGEE